MRAFYLLLVLVGVFNYDLNAQLFFKKNINWLSGYQTSVTGEVLTYTSAYPDYVNQSLLTRCTDGKKEIEWLTASVAQQQKDEYVYFRWVAAHSTGTSKGQRFFDLYIDNIKVLTFSTQAGNKNPVWQFTANDSTSLIFEQSLSDAVNDAHGICYLRVPSNRVTTGKPLALKVIGQAQQSNDWYMTFKYAFEEKADIMPMPFLLKSGQQVLMLTVLHFGNKEQLQIIVNGKNKYEHQLNDGITAYDIPVDAVNKKTSVHLLIKCGITILKNDSITIEPVVKREIHFIHHSHTDIGYSHLQPEVERIHTKNIYDALRMIKQTANYPDAARFRWNIESLWAVENFMQKATAQEKEEFISAVKSGSIGLSAMYANILTGLSVGDEVFHYTDYAQQLEKDYGVEINSAMISDIPGHTWDIVTGFAKRGIKYFSSGPNYMGANHPYMGDRVGHFAKTWGDKPVWWQSPGGNEKLLFWTAGRGYSSWHGFAPGAIFNRGSKRIAAYLNELTEKKYPYQLIQWRYNCVADNAPIDSTISDFVKQWNEKYQSPIIILNTTDKLFQKFESMYGKNLPVVKGDITPYWEDGATSTAHEEGVNRVNSLKLQQLTNMYSLLAPEKFEEQKFYEAWRDVLMFHEHTWGAHNSISEPGIDFVKEQWRIKKEFQTNGDAKIAVLWNAIAPEASISTSKKIAIVNTLNWQRNGAVTFASSLNVNSVMDENGKILPVQSLANNQKVFVIDKLLPFETKYFTLAESRIQERNAIVVDDNSISNGLITVRADKVNGSIAILGKDLSNYTGKFNNAGINNFCYVPGLDPAMATNLRNVKVEIMDDGPIKATLCITGEHDVVTKLTAYITIYSGDDKVYVENYLEKKEVMTKEAAYFSFPFANGFNSVTADAGYGTLHYLKDQLPGSNLDFVCNKRWLDASGENAGVQLITIESAMLCPDSLMDERLVIDQAHKKWKEHAQPTSTWHSYLMNNYWHTNYKASQGGYMRFRYVINPHAKLAHAEQEKSALEVLQPIVVFSISNDEKLPSTVFESSNDKIIVRCLEPINMGYKMRLYNPEPSQQKFNFTFISNSKKYVAQNNPSNQMEFAPFELVEVELKAGW
ncbi:MAG: glycoside hydrolase [Bacteroidetes bacterium]|nr:glycoside hydrolase [Bacteroidota bacterium]